MHYFCNNMVLQYGCFDIKHIFSIVLNLCYVLLKRVDKSKKIVIIYIYQLIGVYFDVIDNTLTTFLKQQTPFECQYNIFNS
jgi:hypothetical protein